MRRKIQDFIDKNRWLKAVPNILTVFNSLCGFLAILTTLKIYNYPNDSRLVLVISSCMILGAMVFDALDGFAARILNAASLKGIQMDSLADMVTFGVAPAVLVSVIAHKYAATPYGYPIAWALSAIYLAAAAHRLARYNVMTMVQKKSSQKFYGLSTTAAAAAICSIVFLLSSNEIDSSHYIVKILPFYAGFLGILMVSNIRYQHVGKWLVTVRRNNYRIILLTVVIVMVCVQPSISIAIVVNIYVFYGLFKDIYRRMRASRYMKS